MTSLGLGRGTQSVLLRSLNCLRARSMLHAWHLKPLLCLTRRCPVLAISPTSFSQEDRVDTSASSSISSSSWMYVARLFSFDPDVSLNQSQPLRHTDTRAFRSVGFLFQIPVRQQTFSLPPWPRHPPRSSPACDEKSCLSCWIAHGPTSSECDLTLMTSVLPLRPSINGKKNRPQVPIRPFFQLAPLCDTFRIVLRVNRESDVGLFVDATKCLNGSPEEQSVCLAPGLRGNRCAVIRKMSHSRCAATPKSTCLRLLRV